MALLPPFFLDAVVAIGIGDGKKIWIGTGFLYADLYRTDPDPTKKSYLVWLITNKHVLQDLKKIYIRFNSAESAPVDYEIPLIARNGKARWIGHPHPEVDVAAIYINPEILRRDGRQFSAFRSDDHSRSIAELKMDGASEGDGVFVLGFPMGLVSQENHYAICRGGFIARIRDTLDARVKDFLVDSPAFPGNSGGPVISMPSAVAIQGTKTNKRADLIGIVKSYIPYSEVAISPQTNLPRISFQENSGLTAVESVDSIQETVAVARKRVKARMAQVKYRKKQIDQTMT